MLSSFQFNLPVHLIFGPGALKKLHTQSLPGKKALIVTTNGGSVKKNGSLDTLMQELDQAEISYECFSEITANPSYKDIDRGTQKALDTHCDFIIGLGGGSAIDAAKAIAVLCKNSGCFWDYIQRGSGGKQFPKNGAFPIVAIPTTAGTGTEGDPWLVVSNPDTEEKIGCGWNFTYPMLSIIDPCLMTSIPPFYTAIQGMDAFFHAAEGYVATCATSISRVFSIKAIAALFKYLPIAVKEPENLEARTMVTEASTFAGVVESLSDTISLHYVSHALTAFHENIPHGAALTALCIPYFEHLIQKDPLPFSELARDLGHHFSTPKEGADLFLNQLKELIEHVGLSTYSLQEQGVLPSEAWKIATKAYETDGHLFSITPAEITCEEMEYILLQCILTL